MAVRAAGWDSQKILQFSNAIAGAGKAKDALRFADAHFGKDLVAYATTRYRAADAAKSVRKMADVMANLEFRSVPSIAEKSLRALNFSTKLVMRGKRCAIEASGKGNAKLLVLIEDGGAAKGVSFKTDWANLADKSCLKMQKEFEGKMAELGVELSDCGIPEDIHMDPRGGQLIKEAGRMHAKDLATGILLYEEREEQFCQSLYGKVCGRDSVQKAVV
jgi:hypothetical protein